jgi:hypothetical protein
MKNLIAKNLVAFVSSWIVVAVSLAQSLPPLNFDAPPGFSGGGDEVATFSTPDRDVVIHIYPFRRLGVGDFQARFRETLLREFVAANLREAKPAAAPQIEAVNVEGAEAALIGRFADEQRARTRLAMLASGAVAVIDVTATSSAAVERHAAAIKELLDSISVGQPKARAAPPPVLATPEIAAAVAAAPAAAAAAKPEAAAPAPLPAFIPGMYVGNVRRLIPSFVGGKESGGMWITGPQYFLLSGDGLAYRNYEQPRLPGGDTARFDWKRAQVNDAANTGTYEVSGGELTLRLGNETISAKLAGPGRFEIFGNYFKRATAQ